MPESLESSRTPTRYWVCTSPRSGSSLLCDLLSQTGELGMRPLDQGRFECLKHLGDHFQSFDGDRQTPAEFFDTIFAGSATPNGVMAFKVMWEQLQEVLPRISPSGPRLRPEDIGRILAADTKFLWLRRRDHQRQAISWNKALQSGGWDIRKQQRFQGSYVYDFPGIAVRMRQIRREEAAWAAFFKACGIEPLTLFYEDYLEDLPATVRRVAEFLEVPLTADVFVDRPHYVRQADALNAEWLQHYQRDTRSPLHSLLALATAGLSRHWWEAFLRRQKSKP